MNLSRILHGPNRRGFTLIELLVVIAIIGILSSVVLSSLNSARVKARDAKRISDLREMRSALELYYTANGTYPSIGGWVFSCESSWSTLQTALSPYMATLPVDPRNSGCAPWTTGQYGYAYRGGVAIGTPDNYSLVAQVEDQSNPNRCQIRNWIFHTAVGGGSWCSVHGYSPYLIADH